jgi:hypothetical protein
MPFRNPLQWPTGQQRTQRRRNAPFKAQHATIINELDRAIRKLGITDVQITTDRRVRIDGQLSMSTSDTAADPSIAMYFTRKGEDVCIAFDKFNDIWGNLRAVGLYLEYMARLETYDMTEMADKAFTGFTALPEHATAIVPPRKWYDVLEVQPSASMDVITGAYHRLLHKTHPDKGGNNDAFIELQDAYKKAKEEQ